MSSQYPEGIDEFETDRTDETVMSIRHPNDHNDYADAINRIEATLGQNPHGVYDTVAQRLAFEGMRKVTIPVSSAQLLDLQNTPVELVPAPGAGKFVIPILLTAEYIAGATPYAYAGGNGLTFGSPGSALNALSGYPITDTPNSFGIPLKEITSTITFVGFPSTDWDNRSTETSDLMNAPLQMTIDANPLTDGDGSMVITVLYTLSE